MRKEIKFTDKLSKAIQEYASKHYEHNFNMAVRVLCSAGLAHFENKEKESNNESNN